MKFIKHRAHDCNTVPWEQVRRKIILKINDQIFYLIFFLKKILLYGEKEILTEYLHIWCECGI